VRWLIRWIAEHLAIGLGATAVAIGVALVIDLLASGWTWDRFALLFLALAVFLLLSAFIRDGVDPPGVHGLGWDARMAYIETVAREKEGTASEFTPPSGGVAALLAILPPAIAVLLIVSVWL
jgi:hypothetical protein